mgnify:CR=1 FL=1
MLPQYRSSTTSAHRAHPSPESPRNASAISTVYGDGTVVHSIIRGSTDAANRSSRTPGTVFTRDHGRSVNSPSVRVSLAGGNQGLVGMEGLVEFDALCRDGFDGAGDGVAAELQAVGAGELEGLHFGAGFLA